MGTDFHIELLEKDHFDSSVCQLSGLGVDDYTVHVDPLEILGESGEEIRKELDMIEYVCGPVEKSIPEFGR